MKQSKLFVTLLYKITTFIVLKKLLYTKLCYSLDLDLGKNPSFIFDIFSS